MKNNEFGILNIVYSIYTYILCTEKASPLLGEFIQHMVCIGKSDWSTQNLFFNMDTLRTDNTRRD